MRNDHGEISRILAASGEISDDRPLVAFLYCLLRDHLTMGELEDVLVEARASTHRFDSKPIVFANGWLARYAQDVASRLSP